MEWLRKLSDAIAYIEQNLDAEISYEEAARIACCSPYYFQRMFSYVAGISLSDYIRRRRMSQAAFDLRRCDARVLDVASSMAIPHQPHLTEPFKRFTVSLRQPQKISAKHCMHIRRYSFLSISQEEVLWPII